MRARSGPWESEAECDRRKAEDKKSLVDLRWMLLLLPTTATTTTTTTTTITTRTATVTTTLTTATTTSNTKVDIEQKVNAKK